MKKLILILVVFISCSKKEEISKSEALKGRLYKTYSYINANLIDSNEYIYDEANTVISIKKNNKDFLKYNKINDTLCEVSMFYYIDNIKKIKVCRVTTSSNKIIKIDEFNKVTNSIKSNLLTSTYIGNYPIEITTVEFNDPLLPIVSNIKYNNFIFEGNNLKSSTAGYYVIPYFGFQYWKEESLNNEITNIASSRFISQTLFNSNQLLNDVIYMMNLNDYYIFPKSDNLYSKVGYINNTIDSLEFNTYYFKTHEDTVTQISVKYYSNQIDSFYTKYYYE